MATTITLTFDGYWHNDSQTGVPNDSGVYVVYRGVRNKSTKPITVSLKKLIYIGEAKEVRDRIGDDHEKRPEWKKELKSGEVLYFSFAPANKTDRIRAEAALIYKIKPTCNEKGKDSFCYEDTTVKSSGMCNDIPAVFTVKKHVPK